MTWTVHHCGDMHEPNWMTYECSLSPPTCAHGLVVSPSIPILTRLFNGQTLAEPPDWRNHPNTIRHTQTCPNISRPPNKRLKKTVNEPPSCNHYIYGFFDVFPASPFFSSDFLRRVGYRKKFGLKPPWLTQLTQNASAQEAGATSCFASCFSFCCNGFALGNAWRFYVPRGRNDESWSLGDRTMGGPFWEGFEPNSFELKDSWFLECEYMFSKLTYILFEFFWYVFLICVIILILVLWSWNFKLWCLDNSVIWS